MTRQPHPQHHVSSVCQHCQTVLEVLPVSARLADLPRPRPHYCAAWAETMLRGGCSLRTVRSWMADAGVGLLYLDLLGIPAQTLRDAGLTATQIAAGLTTRGLVVRS